MKRERERERDKVFILQFNQDNMQRNQEKENRYKTDITKGIA